MQGKTHTLGGTVCALGGFIVMKENGHLLDSSVVSQGIQFLAIYSAGIYGGKWSDNDHHWGSSPLHDPVSWVQNKVLHIFNKPLARLDDLMERGVIRGKQRSQLKKSFKYRLLSFLACKHRSWQTHSEVTLLSIYLLMTAKHLPFLSSPIDYVIVNLIMLGFGLGVLSHLLLDSLTTEGIRIALFVFISSFFPSLRWTKRLTTFRLVPATHMFATGSAWEMSVRRALSVTQYLLVIVVLLYTFGISVPQIILSYI